MKYLRRTAKGALHLGLFAEQLAPYTGDLPFYLDRPLALFPDAGTRLTVAGIAEQIDDLAGRLHAAGVRTDERVAVYRSYTFDTVLLACAIARLGAVPAMLSHRTDQDTAMKLLKQLDRPRLVTDRALLDGVLRPAPVEELVTGPLISVDEAGGSVSLESLAGSNRPAPVLRDADAPILITHTSGTTGVPKLTIQSCRSLYHQVPQQARLFRMIAFRELMVQCVSMLHARMYSGLALFAGMGVPAAFLTDSDPNSVARILTELRPGGLESHPNIFIRWEELADHPDQPLRSIRLFINGFDAVHPRTVQALLHGSQRRFPIYAQGYGQTEIGLVTGRLYTRWGVRRADFRCVGLPYSPLTKVRITPTNGAKASAHNPGFIEVRSAGRSLSYVGQAELHASQVHDGGWWRMGDMGYRTKWGCVHMLDRQVDQGTGLDSNLAVEDRLIARLDELVEAVLVAGDGLPLPVVCTKGDRPLDRAAWARETADLPPMAEPMQIRWADMPITSTWKIRRPELTRRIRSGALEVLPAEPATRND